jgi:hypothetical protein
VAENLAAAGSDSSVEMNQLQGEWEKRVRGQKQIFYIFHETPGAFCRHPFRKRIV